MPTNLPALIEKLEAGERGFVVEQRLFRYFDPLWAEKVKPVRAYSSAVTDDELSDIISPPKYFSFLPDALSFSDRVLNYDELPQGPQILIERYAEESLDGIMDYHWGVRIQVWRLYAGRNRSRDTEYVFARDGSVAAAVTLATLKAMLAEE